MMKNIHPLVIILVCKILLFQHIRAVDFVLNGFNSSNILLYGSAKLESDILVLTNDTTNSIGRALYRTKIPTRTNSSLMKPFSTSFIFSIAQTKGQLAGHGLVFLFVPFTGIQGSTSSQHLGFLNRTNDGNPENHILGVEFDVFENEEFDDIDANHVGINVNSLKSSFAHSAGYYPDDEKDANDEKSFKKLTLNDGRNYQVWIDYKDFVLNVTMVQAGMKRPLRPLLNVPLNLSGILEDETYVGFTSSTGRLVESHRILAWSFSNSDFSLSDELITIGLPSFVPPEPSVFSSKWFIGGVTVGGFFIIVFIALFAMLLIKSRERKKRLRAEMEDWELEYWPHRMTYQEIEAATGKFTEENVIGIGGNGKVYKGVLEGVEVAVKRMSQDNSEGMREFLAEISSLGRLKHRSLVGLRGWCKKERGVFMLVYDYMENSSLDKWVFDCDESKLLSCAERIRILKDVAAAVLYLHEGWEAKVLHRDIKSSNVLLDKDMCGRLGDFGLARMHDHGQVATTTRVVGTVGYMAPEVIKTGRASAQTDVFGFGILILEVMSGKRPIEDGLPPLVDWVWELMANGELLNALDSRLRAKGGFDEVEVQRILNLGLLCSYPDPNSRPSMRQVVKILEGNDQNEPFELDTEDMEAYLLRTYKKPQDMSFNSACTTSSLSHPTFDDIRRYNSSSMSVSWSNSLLDGR